MPVGNTLADLVRLQQERARTEANLFPSPPQTPGMLKATALIQAIRVEWSQSEVADGYRVAAMPATAQNLAAPQKLHTVEGGSNLEYVEYVGDVATARYYSVQAFKRSVSGEVAYSDWRYPLVTATSKAVGGAADSAPTAPPSAPIIPEDSGDPGDPGGVTPGGEFTA